jgi:ketosteroid isomerase-like protein
MTQSIDVVREVFAAFARGDIERVLELLDEDVEWIEPAGYWVAPGRSRGRAAVEAIIAAYPGRWAEIALEPETFIEAGEHVIVLGSEHGTARETGRSFRGRFANVFEVRSGRVMSLEAFADTALLWKTLGGQPAD